MKLKVYTPNKASTGAKDLPVQFDELIRPDLIKRAVEAAQANRRQPYGAGPESGMRHSTWVSKRRRDFKGCYGKGISRVPRKVLSRRGSQFFWVGALAPGTVGGRKAHPPKAEREFSKKINRKERRKAIRSAMAATVVKGIVEKRGHIVPQDYPFIINSSFENIKKTSEVRTALERMGFKDELTRVENRTIRPGRGKARGRKYRQKRGPLIIVSKKCALLATGKNLPGVDVVEIQNINAELLAPGGSMGRLTLYTESSIDRLANEKLFTKDYQGKPHVKKEKPAMAAAKENVAKPKKAVPAAEKKKAQKTAAKAAAKTEKK